MSFIGKNSSWGMILFIALLPIFRWIQIYPVSYRFFDFSSSMTSLGQITALSGITLFSINLILAGRFRILDRLLEGLSDVYSKHHFIGAVSFSLILFHPLFLALRFIPYSLKDAALFFLPSQNQAMNYGIIALFLFIVLIVLTFFVDLGYKKWKMFHTFMIMVAFFAIMHSLTTSSDISRDWFLRFYILGISSVGFVCAFYQAFMSKFVRKKYFYEVKNVFQVNSRVVEIEMSPKDERMDFEAGQFVFISFIGEDIDSEPHPFSLSSKENDENIRIAIKYLGDYTNRINAVKIRDIAKIEGPYGKFSKKYSRSEDQVWIAGGIGITPFLAMARSLKNNKNKIDLYYSFKTDEDASFLGELVQISKSNPDFRIIEWMSSKKGHLEAKIIFDLTENLEKKDIFLCGPSAFMESIRKQLIKSGISKHRIHWEKFNFF